MIERVWSDARRGVRCWSLFHSDGRKFVHVANSSRFQSQRNAAAVTRPEEKALVRAAPDLCPSTIELLRLPVYAATLTATLTNGETFLQ